MAQCTCIGTTSGSDPHCLVHGMSSVSRPETWDPAEVGFVKDTVESVARQIATVNENIGLLAQSFDEKHGKLRHDFQLLAKIAEDMSGQLAEARREVAQFRNDLASQATRLSELEPLLKPGPLTFTKEPEPLIVDPLSRSFSIIERLLDRLDNT